MSHLTPPQTRTANGLDRPDGLNSSFRSRDRERGCSLLAPVRRRSAVVLDVDWEPAGGELRPPVFGLGRVGGEEKLSSDDGVG